MKKYFFIIILLFFSNNVFSYNGNITNIIFFKYINNPILLPRGYTWEAKSVYTPAVVTNNNKFYMFYRGQDWRNRSDWASSYGVSSIGLAISDDGINFTTRYTNPVIAPGESYDNRGCEDPRIVKIGNRYYITYNGYSTSSPEIKICLASSSDLINWVKHGPINGFENKKHGAIFFKKVNGKYWMYFGDGDLYIASTANDPPTTAGSSWTGWTIENSGNPVIITRNTGFFDSETVRPGPPPFICNGDIGIIYNGVTYNQSLKDNQRFQNGNINEVGWAIFDINDPTHLKARCEEPCLKVTKIFEQIGNVYNSVFASGLVDMGTNLYLYYSCADWCIGMAKGGTNFKAGPQTYYVNDDMNGNEKWCTAAGDDSNDGLSPNTPMRKISTVLETYPMCGGSEIRIDIGNYSDVNLIINNICDTNYLIIRGAGSSSIGSVIDSSGAGTECFNIQNSKNIKILNLHLKAASANNILINHCSNVIISNCYIKQSFGNGINIMNSSNNIIIDNKIGDNTDPNNNFGILINNRSGKNYIVRNEVWKNKWAGIDIRDNSFSNTILSNMIHHQNEEGIKIEKSGGGACKYNKIIGNKIYDNNQSDGADKGGIRVIENSDGTEIKDNQVYNNKHEWNIGIKNAKNCIVKNNIVYNCNGSGGERVGIGFWYVTNSIISNNKIYNNIYDGIKIADSSVQNRIEYNTVYDNGEHGIFVANVSHNNWLFRNILYNNTSDGIKIDLNSDRVIVINNTSFKNGKGVLFDSNCTECTLRNNIAMSNIDEGFQSVNSADVTNCYNDSYNNGSGDYVGSAFRTGPNNISVDPLFQTTDSDLSNFLYLSSSSPCRDAGAPTDPVPQNGGSRVDMGAIEFMTLLPGKPQWISSILISTNQIDLLWHDLPNETSYTLFRNSSNNTNTATKIAGLTANVTNYSDTSLTANMTYFYWLKAYNTYGSSFFSAVISNSTSLPSPPVWISAIPMSTNQIDLLWHDLPNETSYTLFRNSSNNTNTATKIAGLTANVTNYSDTSLTANMTYFYWLKAYNSSGSSSFSAIISNTTPNGKIFYVNDGSTNRDLWCKVSGNDANTGLSPYSPKASITNLFNTYIITGGKEIRIDTGTYYEQIIITNNDNGDDTDYLIITGAGTNEPGSETGTKIDGGSSKNYCFYLQNRKRIKLKNMRINASTNGANIYLNSCTNIIVTNCKVYYAIGNGAGIKIVNYSKSNIVVKNNIGSDPTKNNYGIFISDESRNNLILKNEIWKTKLAGIDIRSGSHSNTIQSNIIRDSGEEGIKIQKAGGIASKYNNIIGNIIYKNNESNGAEKGGIRIIEGSDWTKIIGNSIYSNRREWNISIRDTKNCIISNNKIYKCLDISGGERVGIGLWNATNCIISGNEVYNNPLFGIKIVDSSISNIIEWNKIENNGYSGIFIDIASSYNNINYNFVNNNGYSGDSDQNKCGIFIGNGSSYCRLFRNISSKNNNDGLRTQDTGGGACVGTSVINNTFFNNGGRGVLFDNNSTSCTLRNNIAESNGGEGFMRVSSATGLTQSYNNSYGNSGVNFNFQGDTLGTGTINSNSHFQSTDPSVSSFLWISSNSPCIDKGDPADTVPPGGGNRIDIGRYEYMTNDGTCAMVIPDNNLKNVIQKADINIIFPFGVINIGQTLIFPPLLNLCYNDTSMSELSENFLLWGQYYLQTLEITNKTINQTLLYLYRKKFIYDDLSINNKKGINYAKKSNKNYN